MKRMTWCPLLYSCCGGGVGVRSWWCGDGQTVNFFKLISDCLSIHWANPTADSTMRRSPQTWGYATASMWQGGFHMHTRNQVSGRKQATCTAVTHILLPGLTSKQASAACITALHPAVNTHYVTHWPMTRGDRNELQGLDYLESRLHSWIVLKHVL